MPRAFGGRFLSLRGRNLRRASAERSSVIRFGASVRAAGIGYWVGERPNACRRFVVQSTALLDNGDTLAGAVVMRSRPIILGLALFEECIRAFGVIVRVAQLFVGVSLEVEACLQARVVTKIEHALYRR